MTWLSSSLTSQVVSLVMLHESRPRRSQRNKTLAFGETTALLHSLPVGRQRSFVRPTPAQVTALGAQSRDTHCCPRGGPVFRSGPRTCHTPATSPQTAETLSSRKSNVSLLFNIFTTLARTPLLLQES